MQGFAMEVDRGIERDGGGKKWKLKQN